MLSLLSYGYLIGGSYDFLVRSIDGLPPDHWWIPACVIMILAATAVVDAFSGIIPDLMIVPGIVAITVLLGLTLSWTLALHNLGWGVAGYLLVWATNTLWYLRFQKDALGMGDAKWTILAMAAFGLKPVLMAWGMAAWAAIFWLILLKLMRRPGQHVHFAPFLFFGLIAGLWLMENPLNSLDFHTP